jgi:hypothetical protein
MNDQHMHAAIDHLKAVPASPFHARRFGVSHVYFADETRRWHGVTRAGLAALGATLGEPDAYSRWCSEHGTDALPFVVTDRNAGTEEHFTVRDMDEAELEVHTWLARVGVEGEVRLIILAPFGDGRLVRVFR